MSLVALAGVTRHVELPDGSDLQILRGVDLTVDVGDHVSIVGRSGSGNNSSVTPAVSTKSPNPSTPQIATVPRLRHRSRAGVTEAGG